MVKYRSTENIRLAAEAFNRAATQLIKKAQTLEETGDLSCVSEAIGVIKNTHNNIHLDNWISSLIRDMEDKNKDAL